MSKPMTVAAQCARYLDLVERPRWKTAILSATIAALFGHSRATPTKTQRLRVG